MRRVILGILVLSAAAFAEGFDLYQVGYAANMNIGDSTINLTSAGQQGGFEPDGNICANVYVLAEDQQLVSCCACPLTPNHLKTLSVRNDLISNTLTPGVPIGVTIGLLASKPNTPGAACNAATVDNLLGNGLRAWFTTIHAAPDGTYHVTEVDFAQLGFPFPSSIFDKLTSYCGFIQANGSGYGICKSCREGAAGAARQ